MTIDGGKSVEDLEAEAAAWAIKLDAAQDRIPPGLNEWCAHNPRHAGALLRAQATLALFDPASRPEETRDDEGQAPRRKRLLLMGGGAAALAASLAALLLIRSPGERYETQIGELRSVALSDGSSVSIDARSRIDIAFNAKTRDVRLQSGKALFRAAHNAQRPFRVIVDHVVITDIGTTFQVADDDRSGDVEVLVTQGAVRVDSPQGRVDLTAGQRARFSQVKANHPRPATVRVASVDVERMLAWRDGRLELDGETLDSAVADINRHSRLQLRVADAGLGRESLYGSFRMDDAAGFAHAAAVSLGTDVRTGPDGIVIGAQKK